MELSNHLLESYSEIKNDPSPQESVTIQSPDRKRNQHNFKGDKIIDFNEAPKFVCSSFFDLKYPANSLSWHSNERYLAAGLENGMVKVWNMFTNQEIDSFSAHPNQKILIVSFHPFKDFLVIIGGGEKNIKVLFFLIAKTKNKCIFICFTITKKIFYF